MVPGYLQGTYTEEEIAVDIPRLTGRAGGRFVAGSAVAVDPARRAVLLAGGEELSYDLVSFAVGADTAGADAPEVAGHAQRIKPLARVVALRERLLELARSGGDRSVAVIGGGAAGVEVILAGARVLDEAGGGRRLTLVESGEEILAGYTDRFRARARRLLGERGVFVRTGREARAVRADAVELDSGEEIPADLAVWLTGAVSVPLFRSSGLPLDRRGFLLLDDALRSLADPRIFAAGDCGTLARYPDTPKAGVYAVREAPILWASLKATLEGRQPPSYRPQSDFLSLLNTGDGCALLQYKGQVAYGRWAFQLKDWIDRRFLARYR
jgi:selenide,water dikinase